jgi:hypothetical protein
MRRQRRLIVCGERDIVTPAKDKKWAELSGVEVVSGTAQDAEDQYRGFVTIRAVDMDGSVMMGQLSPPMLRSMALQFLEVAEAADQDAIVMTMMTRDFGLPVDTAAMFVHKMRDERA